MDPYWDFEHALGELYDASALRLWRLRVFVSKPAQAQLSITGMEDGPAEVRTVTKRLAADEHILRYGGGAEREARSYDRLSVSLVEVRPPSTTFVVNLTGLDPGSFLVQSKVLGARQQQREMRFRIVRRPFFLYPGLPSAKAPIVRCHSGIRREIRGGQTVDLADYRWTVERYSWESGEYQPDGSHRIVATVELERKVAHWYLEEPSAAEIPSVASPARKPMETYTTSAGLGLVPPTLYGAPH